METGALGNCPVLASYRWAMVPLESLEIEIVAVQLDQLIAVDHVALDTLDDDYSVVGLYLHINHGTDKSITLFKSSQLKWNKLNAEF